MTQTHRVNPNPLFTEDKKRRFCKMRRTFSFCFSEVLVYLFLLLLILETMSTNSPASKAPKSFPSLLVSSGNGGIVVAFHATVPIRERGGSKPPPYDVAAIFSAKNNRANARPFFVSVMRHLTQVVPYEIPRYIGVSHKRSRVFCSSFLSLSFPQSTR